MINFHGKQKLSPKEDYIKQQIFDNYDLILNVVSGYDDVLISSTIINYERVAGFTNDRSNNKIIKNKP